MLGTNTPSISEKTDAHTLPSKPTTKSMFSKWSTPSTWFQKSKKRRSWKPLSWLNYKKSSVQPEKTWNAAYYKTKLKALEALDTGVQDRSNVDDTSSTSSTLVSIKLILTSLRSKILKATSFPS
ncbi:hypothetical protein HMI55_004961 [Coelomomyces lativittatus]|nr:hypothetical protein HMI55_004961 [Coelomomyces lativittatus]